MATGKRVYTAKELLAVVAVSVTAFAALGGETAPLNPAFLKWQAERRAHTNVQGGGGLAANSPTAHRKGLVPSTFDRSYLSGFYSDGEAVSPLKSQPFKPILTASSSIPSSYDARKDGKGLTSVKDQNPYGTCWAHATIGCLETWQLVAGKGMFDYSENNLANLHGRDIPFSDGGNGDFASAYLLRWSGPVLEASDPYPNVGGSPSNLEPVLHVQNVKWIPARSSPTDNAVIKKAVMKYGAVYASYYHEPSASGGVDLGTKTAYWNPPEGAYYRSSYEQSNHAICIVGWDDNYSAGKFSTKPPADGAFLIKNSWGTDFGKSGYRGFCWISYYDAGLAGRHGQYSETSYVFADTEAVDNYDDIYQYDPLGLVTTYGSYGGSRHGAAMFVAREDVEPSAIGIYLPEPYAKYEIAVYSGCTAGDPSSGTKIGSASGNAGEFAGYQTIPVDLTGTVDKGTRFSAVVKITTASTLQLAIECPIQDYSSKATANSGETFFSQDGSSWSDFTAKMSRASFCCKVYTKRAAVSGTYTVRFAANGGSGTMADRTYSYGKSYTLPANGFTKDGYAFTGWSWAGGSFPDCGEISFESAVSSPLTLIAQWQKVAATKPSSPVISEVTSGDLDSISVSWTAVPGAKYYNLYWCASNEFPSTQDPIKVSGTAYLDTERMPGLEIYYWVSAVNDAGESAVSSSKSGYRAATCAVSPVSFSLAADGVTDAEVSVDANSSWRVLSKDDWIVIEDGIGPAGGATFHFSVGANASTASRSGTIAIGTSAIDHRVTRTISVYQARKTKPLPGVPEMVKSTYTANGFYLSWNAASNAKSYKIYRSQNPDYFGVGETCIVSGLETTSFIDAEANWLFAYNYRVAAVNDEGETSGPVVTLQGSLSGEAVVIPSMTSGKFQVSGGHASVIISLIGADEWEATSSTDWLTLSATAGKSNGGFTVTASKNTTSSSRMATVLVGAGYKIGGTYLSSATIVFTQEAGDGSGGSGDVTAQVSVSIPAKGGTANGYVKTPAGEKWEFLLSGRPSWITSIMSAGADVTESSSYSVSADVDYTWQLRFTASENTGDAREWTIPIMRDGVLLGLVAVRQGGVGDEDEGGGDDSETIPVGGGSKSFVVEYPPSEMWEFDISKRPSWVTQLLVGGESVPSSCMSFGQSSDLGGIVEIEVTASANAGAERSWTIPITCGGAARGKVEVVQAGNASSGLPAEPETPVVTAKDATTVMVSWSKADGAQKYKLWRADGGKYAPSDFKLIVTQTGTAYTDSKLTPETTYCYKVSAVNGKGETMSPYMASVTTPVKGSSGGNESVGTLLFGPGHGSRFNVSSGEKAFVVGVSSLTWANFAKRTYMGEQSEDDDSTYSFYTFDDPRIVDAEKNSTKEDFDDCWCSALSEMNILFWTGWIGGYADEDAVKDYMRQRADEVDEDTGGWDFYDLVSQNFNESYYGEATSLQSFTKAFEGADRLFCLCVDYDENYIWKGMGGVSHAVVCCGYSLDTKKTASDPSALKALFIIDSDNDMYNGAGGLAAPDSITYCPVKWNTTNEVYEISNVFGATGTFVFNKVYLYSICTRTAPTLHITDGTAPGPEPRKVAFNANGGKVSVASASYFDGDEYTDLPVPTRVGYKFDGWYTAKTGGELVKEGEIVDFSLLDAKSPAIYAHWLKAYTLTLKGAEGVGASYQDGDGETFSGAKVLVLQGDAVSISAPDSYFDKNDVEYIFQQWTASKSADFGEEFDVLSTETTLQMPASDITLTATYIAETKVGYLTATATAEAKELDSGLVVEPPFEQFQWSIDGKTWFPSEVEILVDTGGKSKTFSVQWRSLSDSWAAPSGKTSVKVAYDDAAAVESAPFVYVPVATVTSITIDNFGEWSESTVGGSAVTNPKDGRLVTGKAMTFTAKANKNYAFVGWALLDAWDWDAPQFESVQATYKTSELAMEATNDDDFRIHYAAVFRAISSYRADDMENVFGAVCDKGGNEVPVTVGDGGRSVALRAVVGCSTTFDVMRGCKASCYPLTFKTSGKLPAGLKFDAKTGVVSGTPSKAESQILYVTAADPAGNKASLAITVTVSALSADIAGEYRALLRDGDSGLAAGLLELSVTSAGKVSAKVTTANGAVSLKPELVCEIDHADEFDTGTYHFIYQKESGTATSGSYEILRLEPSVGNVFYEKDVWSTKGDSSVYLVGEPVHVDASAFANEEFKAAFLNRYYTVVLHAEGDGDEGFRSPEELTGSGYLTAAVDKKGGVKVAGKLPDGTAVSASSSLIPSDDFSQARVLVFAAPSGYKKNGYVALELGIDEYGGVSGDDGTWVTPPLYDAPSDEFAEDEETLPGLLLISAEGSIYNEFDKVEEYYLSLSADDPGVLLEYSYNDGEKNKVFETVDAVGDFGLLGSPEILFSNNKISVGKSPKIWKDSEGLYHYDETKEDRNGDTQSILNPAELSMSFTKATGVFSGKFNVYFDYDTPKYDRHGDELDPVPSHKSVSVPYAGVVIHGEEGSAYGAGSGQYTGKFTLEYEDAKGNAKTKTYSKTWAIGLELEF